MTGHRALADLGVKLGKGRGEDAPTERRLLGGVLPALAGSTRCEDIPALLNDISNGSLLDQSHR